MNIFQRALNSLKRASERVLRIQQPKPAELPEYIPDISAGQKLTETMKASEKEALQKAMNILLEAEEHPDDASWNVAREKALIYINKSQRLVGGGQLQRKNRRRAADTYIENAYSTPEGVAAIKKKKLDTFNSNFGFDLSAEEADTIGKIMQDPSFKKLMEQFSAMYDVIIGMVGDEVSKNVDPDRIRGALDMWSYAGIEPDFENFANVTALNNEQFRQLDAEIRNLTDEQVTPMEPQEWQEAVEGVLGKYITW